MLCFEKKLFTCYSIFHYLEKIKKIFRYLVKYSYMHKKVVKLLDIYTNKIKPLFDRTGMSDFDLEKAIGLPRSIIYKWNNGINKSYKKYIPEISSYFKLSMDYFSENEQKNKPLVNNDEELTEYLEMLKTRPEMKMLFNLAAGATKEDVEKAVKIVEAFLKKD